MIVRTPEQWEEFQRAFHQWSDAFDIVKANRGDAAAHRCWAEACLRLDTALNPDRLPMDAADRTPEGYWTFANHAFRMAETQRVLDESLIGCGWGDLPTWSAVPDEATTRPVFLAWLTNDDAKQPLATASLETPAGSGLDPTDLKILQAMADLGAVSSLTLQTQDKIAQAAIELRADRDSVKDRLLSLKKLGYTDSKGSRGGGCWPTPMGLELVGISRTDSRPIAH